MSTPSVRVEFGHVLDVLQGMPEQSVQLIATSPPYFGLRDSPHVQLDLFEDAYV